MDGEIKVSNAKTPFDRQPADLRGCGKPAVMGCLALLVILAIGLVVFLVKARDMLDWALVKYQGVVVESLATDVTQPERRRLEAAFAAARNAIRENRMDPSALQELQRFMSSPPRPNQPITSETVRDLTEVLESVAKTRAELPGSRPAAVPASGLTAAMHHVVV